MIGPIYNDLFKLSKYLPNQLGVVVKFYGSKPEFCLISNAAKPEFTIHLEDMVLKIAKVKVNLSIIYSHAESLKKTNAKYHFVKTECKMLSLPAGEISMCWDNVFQSHSPRKFVVAFVNFYSVGGQFPTNPFNFQGYDLKHITVFVDGHPVGGNPIKMNFDDSGGQSVTETLL